MADRQNSGSSSNAAVSYSEGMSSGSLPESASVPTDLTVTSDDFTARPHPHRRPAHNVHSLAPEDRSRLMQQIELLKLKLSAREEQMKAAEVEHRAALNRVTHNIELQLAQSQAENTRLRSELNTARHDLCDVQERAARELATLTQRCANLQSNISRLSAKNEEIRSSLDHLTVTKASYDTIKSIPVDKMNLKQYVTLRVCERLWPLQSTINELQDERTALQQSLSSTEQQLRRSDDKLEQHAFQIANLERKLQDSKAECQRLCEENNDQDFRVQNYGRVKQERDAFQEELLALQVKYQESSTNLESKTKECSVLSERLDSFRSQNKKIENESRTAKEELNELQKRFSKLDSDCETANKELRAERERSTDLQTKYINLKTDSSVMTENFRDLQNEKDSLKEQIEQLNTLNLQMERRIEDLEARCTNAISEAEKWKVKYNRYKEECEAEVSELRSSLLKGTKHQGDIAGDNSKLQRELQRVKSDLQHVLLEKERNEEQLIKELREANSSLKAYKDLEKEYEESLKALASAPDGETHEGLTKLFPGLCIRGSKVVEQTVRLSSRVLKLERKNTEACDTIRSLTSALKQLRNSLYSYKCAVTSMAEPTQSLHLKIVHQEDQITSLQEALDACQKSKTTLVRDKERLHRQCVSLRKSLEECGPKVKELNNIKSELFSCKKILLKLVNPKVRTSGIPSGIKITKEYRRN